MSATSFKPLPTLQGLFTEQKINHRRNFLLENKLSLREKPNRLATRQEVEKQKQEKQQNQKVQHQRIQQLYERKRSASLAKARNGTRAGGGGGSTDRGDSLNRQFTNLSLRPNRNKGGNYLYENKPTQQQQANFVSTQRSRRSLHEQQFSHRQGPTQTPKNPGVTQRNGAHQLRSSGSSHSVSKNIQTEDITDEDFLINALQKCTNNELKTLHNNHENFLRNKESDEEIPKSQRSQLLESKDTMNLEDDSFQNDLSRYDDGAGEADELLMQNDRMNAGEELEHRNMLSSRVQAEEDANHRNILSHRSNEVADRTVLQSQRLNAEADTRSILSQHSQIIKDTGRKSVTAAGANDTNHGVAQSHRSNVGSYHGNNNEPNVTDVYIGDGGNNGLQGLDIPAVSTGRSRASVVSNKSRRTPHQLGSRDNIRLPAYLERENREKAAEALRASQYDPDCPPGYYLLSEEERLEALKGIQSRFDNLVTELNRLPVTMDTMRVRSRRVAIEKELALLETDTLNLSKHKVYVKRDHNASGDN